MPLASGARFGPYEIAARLGEGGMGVVYRAFDTRLRRDVAIKLLPEFAASDTAAAAALLHEARSAAALNHPHICTIHEVGEIDGHPFIAMEVIAGESLLSVVRRGALPPDRVSRVGRELADALEHAHAHGIVHGDLKSANVMITPDRGAKILDFGIARRRPLEPTAATRTVTAMDEPGRVAGTLAYMAPELLRGEPATIASDIWAFGIVLYEMTTGVLPFAGATTSILSAAILRDEPIPLPTAAPTGLTRVIERCLAKEPRERPGRAGEIALALDVLVGAPPGSRPDVTNRRPTGVTAAVVAVVAAALIGVVAWQTWSPDVLPDPRVDAIAVLPFENLSRDPEQEYFSDGMTDSLITDLGKVSALRVIARGSVMRYKRQPKAPSEVARELNVDALVQGAVLRVGDRVRITAELIDPRDGRLMWSERYERELGDVLALQSEIAGVVAGQVHASIAPEEAERLRTRRPVNPKAQELYLLGRYHTYRLNREGLSKAVEYLRQAVAIDPGFARAHAALSEAYRHSEVWAGYGVGAFTSEIRDAASTAMALDDSLAEPHFAMAEYLSMRAFQWSAADVEFRRALELNPSLAEAIGGYAYFLQTLGRHDEAVAAARRATMLEPLSPYQLAQEGRVLYRARQYEASLARFERALEIEPGYIPALSRASDSCIALRRFADAAAYVTRLKALDGSFANRQMALLYANTGQPQEARAILATVEQESVAGADLAYVFAALGDHDAALAQLERMVREGTVVPFALRDPRFDSIAASPRFHAVLKSVNLQP